MAADVDTMKDHFKEKETEEMKTIVLRDIEPLMKQKFGDHVIVENFTTESLLPPGENYGSTIMKVVVDLNSKLNGENKQVHLIAKMMPPTDFQRLIFNSSKTFFKEIFMYETIMPAYNKIEVEAGFKLKEIFNFLPDYYGSRMSLQPDVKIDDDAVILMENLKYYGYYHGDRLEGYDYKHSKIAVEAMARFHALGIAVKQKKPGLFEVFKMHTRVVPAGGQPSIGMFDSTLKAIKEDPEMCVYYDKCKKIIDKMGTMILWTDVPREPWMTIIHTDFWVNNVLFHQDSTGKIDDLKLIDFQTYIYASALRDLLLYLFSSVQTSLTIEELETLMELYFETLLKRLKQLKCDLKGFDKEAFWATMKENATSEFLHLAMMIKILTMDVKNTDFNVTQMRSIIDSYEGNEKFVERIRRLILYFGKRGWLPED